MSVDRVLLQQALDTAAPLIRSRLAAVQDARWRASDRDRFARRLIPWVLSAARRAARRGDGEQLTALDALVSRLASGMTAGEELLPVKFASPEYVAVSCFVPALAGAIWH